LASESWCWWMCCARPGLSLARRRIVSSAASLTPCSRDATCAWDDAAVEAVW
jgi:hypothetical protein